jgi:hypothetical protein
MNSATALILMVWVANHTTAYNIDKRILTPFTASSPLLLVKLVRGRGHFEATTKSRQSGDTRSDGFEFLPQLHPDPVLQLGSLLSLGKPLRRRDLAVRHILTVRFGSDAGAVHKRTRTNLGRAGRDLYSDTGGAVVDIAVEVTLAEASRRYEGLAID